jgi:hypothetical protein
MSTTTKTTTTTTTITQQASPCAVIVIMLACEFYYKERERTKEGGYNEKTSELALTQNRERETDVTHNRFSTLSLSSSSLLFLLSNVDFGKRFTIKHNQHTHR